jgi:plastocyanin
MRSGHYWSIAAALALGAMAVPAHAATIQIVIEKMMFSPAEVSAKAGDTIEWINKDFLAHTATARNGDFDLVLQPNKSASFVVKKPGSIDYYCRFHPNMKAKLVVAP